jgi:hypothetical protein
MPSFCSNNAAFKTSLQQRQVLPACLQTSPRDELDHFVGIGQPPFQELRDEINSTVVMRVVVPAISRQSPYQRFSCVTRYR